MTLTPIRKGSGIPAGADVPRLMIPKLTWLNHVHNVVVNQGGDLQQRPVTYSGYFAHGIGDSDIRPKASIGEYPYFPTVHMSWKPRNIE